MVPQVSTPLPLDSILFLVSPPVSLPPTLIKALELRVVPNNFSGLPFAARTGSWKGWGGRAKEKFPSSFIWTHQKTSLVNNHLENWKE